MKRRVDDSFTLVPLAMRQKGASSSSLEMLLKSLHEDLGWLELPYLHEWSLHD
jgi:hypothetical protein